MDEQQSNSRDTVIFNQAVYQQLRIHELLQRADRLSVNPLMKNLMYGCYNYEVIFRDYNSVLLTISARITQDEINKMVEMREKIQSLINSPIISKDYHGKIIKINLWNQLNNLLFVFRSELERLMDIHGFGNPLKDDPRKSMLKQ